MLGVDYSDYGAFFQSSLGKASACISAGGDSESPSLGFKGNSDHPNEDALYVARDGLRYLLAVADSHFGNQASHVLIQRLAQAAFPADADELLQTVMEIQEPELLHGAGSTFVVSVVDLETGCGYGFSAGDSSLVTIDSVGLKHHVPHNHRFFYFQRPLTEEEWCRFEFQLAAGDLVLLFTDGVNECHYRKPETSIQDSHIQELWKHAKGDTKKFTALLTQLALDGVMGNPGGQDNIALVGLARPFPRATLC